MSMAAKRPHDDDVRSAAATDDLWQIWSRSGDAAIDTLYQRGMQEMQDSRLPQAVATFNATRITLARCQATGRFT